ncbi:MAG: TlpA family protein disulfide reductase [Gammaproteobacteria bacterium]|nr:MAG: TlpA family protein disulfide reductase [Gammaproteobacteria bacterium]
MCDARTRPWLAAVLSALLLAQPAGATEPGEVSVTPLRAEEFSDLLGGQRGQVLLVNFWATWCAPCLKEIPALQSLERRFAARGFRLLAMNLDAADSIDSIVLPFLRQRFPDFRSYASLEFDMDTMVSVVDPAWNEVLPTSYLLDRDGRVAARLQGGKSAEEFAAAIEPLLD